MLKIQPPALFFKADKYHIAFSTETLLVMTRPVHCFTLSRGGRAESDFEQQRAKQTKLHSRVNTKSRTDVIRMTDNVTKGD